MLCGIASSGAYVAVNCTIQHARVPATGEKIGTLSELGRDFAAHAEYLARTRKGDSRMKKYLHFTFAALLLALSLSNVATAASKAESKSLYDRLGGAYPIAVVVDDFIERLLVNETLNVNPAIKEARARVPSAGLKFHVTTLVCQVTGGPCKYVGRDMKTSHANLNISEKEWQVMLADFGKTLAKFKVPVAEQRELIDIVNSTKSQIVATGK
jgi:hemoglobin